MKISIKWLYLLFGILSIFFGTLGFTEIPNPLKDVFLVLPFTIMVFGLLLLTNSIRGLINGEKAVENKVLGTATKTLGVLAILGILISIPIAFIIMWVLMHIGD